MTVTIRFSCCSTDEIFANLYGEDPKEYRKFKMNDKADSDDKAILKSIDGLTQLKHDNLPAINEATSNLIETINKRYGIFDEESKRSVQRSMSELLVPFESHIRDTQRLMEIQKEVTVINDEANEAILSRFKAITADIDKVIELALSLEEDNLTLWSYDKRRDYRDNIELISERIKEDL